MFSSIKDKLFKRKDGEWLKNIMGLASGAVLAQAIVLGTTPIVSRIYSPERFADLALVMAIYSIIGVTASFKYDAAIMLPKSERQSDYIFSICLYFALIVFIILALAGFIIVFNDFKILKSFDYSGIFFAVFTGLAFSVYITCNVRFNRKKNYYALVRLPIIQSGIISVLAIIFGVVGFESGLVSAQIFGVTAVSCCAVFMSREGIRKVPGIKCRALLKRHIESPKYLFPSTLIDTLSQQLPFFMVILYFDSVTGGHFSMSWRIMMIPMALIGMSISQVFFQRFSVLSGDPIGQIREIFKTWKFLIIVGIFPLLLLLSSAENLFVFALGDKWAEAGQIAVLLAPMFFARFIASPTSTAFIVLGLQRYTFLFAVALLFIRPIILMAGFHYGGLYSGIILLSIVEVLQVVFYKYILLRHLEELKNMKGSEKVEELTVHYLQKTYTTMIMERY